MIPIIIDEKNIELQKLHAIKIKEPILELIRNELLSVGTDKLKTEILKYLVDNIDTVLVGEITKLREIIYDIDKIVKKYLSIVILNLNDYESDLITVDAMKKICKDTGFSGYSKYNKKELASKIFNTAISNHIEIDKLKLKKLKYSIYSHLDEIFINYYEARWDSIKNYTRYDFVKHHSLKTCVYCNRNYILVVDKNGNLRPEIDHFYPKSVYPFLAMSFYNLIPSCSTCNHTKKNHDSFETGLMNPYEINVNDFRFSYTLENVDFLNIERDKYEFEDFDITFRTSHKVNDDVFKLTQLYEQHKDIVLDLLIVKICYPKSYIEELKNSFGFSPDEIYRFILHNYQKDEDMHKRPLSKLIRDIAQEF